MTDPVISEETKAAWRAASLPRFESPTRKTVAAYKRLLSDVPNNVKVWQTGYGVDCRFCDEAEVICEKEWKRVIKDLSDADAGESCDYCPLGDTCIGGTFDALGQVLRPDDVLGQVLRPDDFDFVPDHEDLKTAARNRLAWLIRRLRSAGVPNAWLRAPTAPEKED